MPIVETISLQETARERYLSYALSVIMSRALPDIRDGLKPVQRRILYAMYANLRLTPDARYRKSAAVVGEVMGKYHPHGDTAIYDAMVRMAQDFSLRDPLVDGHGNFGSIDGDNPAAMRYTEVKLRALAVEMLEEIRQDTVDFRPNFDGSYDEPVVLPSRIPNLLVNGADGIAVGMATKIPPHNLREVADALVHLIDHPEAPVEELAQRVPGPDFPTAGRILNTPAELLEIHRTGEGAVELRGDYGMEGKSRIVITSVPYMVNKATLVEKIAEHIVNERVPQLSDVRDESTDDIRVVLELRRGADPEAAIAYLLRHTDLQKRYHVDMTCLVPTENPLIPAPKKVNLPEALRAFLTFRLEVVVRRLRYALERLERRIHILRGFEKLFDALDEAIKLIRASADRKDAAGRLMHRFALDQEQADAILEIKLYRLARMEIEEIRRELEDKLARAADVRAILASEDKQWALVRAEIQEAASAFGTDRKTHIAGPDRVLEYAAEDYIVAEDCYAIVTRDGWIKRQRTYTDIDSIRVRDGDGVGWILPASTRGAVGFFTNFGRCYSLRADTLLNTTGYGDPVQKFFDFSDKEHVVGVVSFDARALPKPIAAPEAVPELFPKNGHAGAKTDPLLVAITAGGQGVRLPMDGFADPSTRKGRTYAKLEDGDEVIGAEPAAGDENVCMASRAGYVLIFPVAEIPVFKSAAKGVIAMRLGADDQVLGCTLSSAARDGLKIETSRGRIETVRTTKFEVARRGNRGKAIIKRGHVARIVPEPVEIRL